MAAPMIRCARQVALRKFVVNRNVRQRRRSDGSDCDREHKCARFPSRFQENSSAIPQDETRGREGLFEGLFRFYSPLGV